MKLQVKQLSSTAKIPTRATEKSAGLDFYADSIECNENVSADLDVADNHIKATVKPHASTKVHTGIAAAIPDGYVGLLFNRSGIAIKQNLRLTNCVGVIDSDYRGEIIAAFTSDSDKDQIITIGDRVAQLVIVKAELVDVELVKELDKTERGEGGFGSTGKQ